MPEFNFEIVGEEKTEPIKFGLRKDDDWRDIVLYAEKGGGRADLLCIDSVNGKVGFFEDVPPQLGLPLDGKGRIELVRND